MWKPNGTLRGMHVTGKSLLWLFYARSLYFYPWCVSFFATFIIIIIHNDLSQRILPPNPQNFKLNYLCLAHREIIWPCPPVNDYKKDEANTLPEACHSRRYLQKLNGLFTVFPHLPPSLIHKWTWHLDWQDGYFEVLVCHLLSQLSFWIVVFLASTPHLSDSLASHAVSEWAWYHAEDSKGNSHWNPISLKDLFGQSEWACWQTQRIS